LWTTSENAVKKLSEKCLQQRSSVNWAGIRSTI
jgi:hypothetical protein